MSRYEDILLCRNIKNVTSPALYLDRQPYFVAFCPLLCTIAGVYIVQSAINLLKHVFASELTIIGTDDGLSSDRYQVVIWTNAGIFAIGPLGTTSVKF